MPADNARNNSCGINVVQARVKQTRMAEAANSHTNAMEVKVLEERIAAQEVMLEMTTAHMTDIQADLAASKAKTERVNSELFSSLRYAQRLQTALGVRPKEICQAFSAGFSVLRQRDLIGGDLAYIRKTASATYVAAIDCTGHGVPGAMLSMLAYSYLNEVVLNNADATPADVLTALNGKVLCTLNDSHKPIADGMDLVLCKFSADRKHMEWAAARRPLVCFCNGKLQILKGTRQSIGETADTNFTNHSLPLLKDDKFYLFTDGITDQFGGPTNKKFGKKRLTDLLQRTVSLTMQKQREIVEATLDAWQGKCAATDDRLIIGLKV